MGAIAKGWIFCFPTIADGNAFLVADGAFFRRLTGIFAVVGAVAVGFIGGLAASAVIFYPWGFADDVGGIFVGHGFLFVPESLNSDSSMKFAGIVWIVK